MLNNKTRWIENNIDNICRVDFLKTNINLKHIFYVIRYQHRDQENALNKIILKIRMLFYWYDFRIKSCNPNKQNRVSTKKIRINILKLRNMFFKHKNEAKWINVCGAIKFFPYSDDIISNVIVKEADIHLYTKVKQKNKDMWSTIKEIVLKKYE